MGLLDLITTPKCGMDMIKTFCDYVLTQSWSHIKQVFYDYYF